MALEDELLRQRHERLAQIRQLGFEPYGHAFNYTHTIPEILAEYGKKTPEELSNPVRVRVAGRIQTIAGKCDSLFIMRQEEAGCDFAVWPSEVVDIGCELVFIEMAGFCEN